MSTTVKPRVLLVDDDVSLIGAVERTLTADGFDVLSTNSPMGVRAMLNTYRPAIVLVDVNLPLMSGDQLLALARFATESEGLRMKFVLYSATDEERLRDLAKASGADGYVSKSDPLERLGAKLRKHLDS